MLDGVLKCTLQNLFRKAASGFLMQINGRASRFPPAFACSAYPPPLS